MSDPRTGGVLVYAPCLPAWSLAFAALIALCEPLLPRRPATRYMYTHLNNTNPVAVPGTALRSTAEVPADGAAFELQGPS
ncbi:hypothetical protein ACQP2P_12605 [Dactylosporangium sp. CA-139114]|uniref:hypothetical protein n=1 Tax=Dactylosporangium sp. CA-139114 TaxID=3239931 RepID=UPI003D96462E